jgi:hypothetical protein
LGPAAACATRRRLYDLYRKRRVWLGDEADAVEMMMRAISSKFRTVCIGVLLVALTGVLVSAHEITVKGTVAAIERARIQVKTGDEKDQSPERYQIDAKTKVSAQQSGGSTRPDHRGEKVCPGRPRCQRSNEDLEIGCRSRRSCGASWSGFWRLGRGRRVPGSGRRYHSTPGSALEAKVAARRALSGV